MNERMKKIVATSWHPGGANAIASVIKRLIEQAEINMVVIAHQFSEKIFQSNGIDYKTIDSYGLKDVSFNSMVQLLNVELPDLVLTGTSSQNDKNRIEQTIILAAREKNIKSLAVLDFWGEQSHRFSGISAGERFKFLPDKITVIDEIARQTMLDEGFDETRLVLTGNPHFDDLSVKARNFTDKEKQTVRRKIGLPVDLLLFFAGNAFMKEKEKLGYSDMDIIKLINMVLKDLPEEKVGVVVKLHLRMPEDDVEQISEYIKESRESRIKIVKDIDSQQLILASDLSLVAFSTIGIEAVYMERPCISLQPGLKEKDVLIVSEKGFIPVGYTADACVRILKKAILDTEYRERGLLKKATDFKTDGRATERVVEVIYKMLKGDF